MTLWKAIFNNLPDKQNMLDGMRCMQEMLTLELLVDSDVLEARKARWQPVKKEIPSKWLHRYALLVSNAANGAVLKTEM